MNILWEAGVHGEDGVTEFVAKCEVCGRLGNMVYRKRGPRGAILKGHVVACNRLCGEEAAGIKPFVPKTQAQRMAPFMEVSA